MRINPIDTTNFQARNVQIRKLDNIVRSVNKEFPTLSVNKYAHFYKAPHFVYKDFFSNLDDKFYYNVRGPLERLVTLKGPLEYFREATMRLKEHRLANCNEMTDLANVIFALNGYKTYKTTLEPNIDHVCLIAHKDQSKNFNDISLECAKKDAKYLHNIIVIDPWLNFVDYAPNAVYKFKNDFAKFIDEPVLRDLNASFLETELPEIYFSPYIESNLHITPDIKAELTKEFPDLILNK